MTKALQTVFTSEADRIGTAVGFTKRPDLAKFTPATFVQTLTFGWLAHPDAPLNHLAQTASRVGVDVSAQAIDQRFTPASAALLQGVLAASLHHLVACHSLAVPLLQRFAGVRVQDSTTITLPDELAEFHQGCGGSHEQGTQAALKCGVQLDLLTGALTALDLAHGRASDRALPMQTAPLPPATLRVADLGFYDLDVLASISEQDGYFLTRLRVDSVITSAERGRQSLHAFVTTVAAEGYDGWVWVGSRQQLRSRLLVVPVPQEVADQRRRRLREEAKDKGRLPSAEALALAAWTILLTNVPARLLSLSEALVLARVRWQIELLFKLWKSHGHIDSWRSERPERIRCEVYAKLLAMVVQHWATVAGCWHDPHRSLVKAAAVVRDFAHELASARLHTGQLEQVLTSLRSSMGRAVRLNTRKKHPNTSQRLFAVALVTTDIYT
jgi:hypothetical protein